MAQARVDAAPRNLPKPPDVAGLPVCGPIRHSGGGCSPTGLFALIALLQRVSEAAVSVAGETIGAIDQGLVALIGVEPGDREAQAERLAERLLAYRVFADHRNRMNLSLSDIQGGLLLVPQFTLLADTQRGNRPSFSAAADPLLGAALFDHLVAFARGIHQPVASGRFGAHMAVKLINDGPVTLSLRVPPAA